MNFFQISEKSLSLAPTASLCFCFVMATVLLAEAYVSLSFQIFANNQSKDLQTFRKHFYKKFVPITFCFFVLADLSNISWLALLPMLWLSVELFVFLTASSLVQSKVKFEKLHDIRIKLLFTILFCTIGFMLCLSIVMFFFSFFTK